MMIWRCPAGARVRFFFATTKSWVALPLLRTTKRAVEPAGTLRRDSEKA